MISLAASPRLSYATKSASSKLASPDSVFPSPDSDDAMGDGNSFPLFKDACSRQRLDGTSASDSPAFFPFQCNGALKRQDALDLVSSPKIEDLLLRASQMKIRASPAHGVLQNIVNALSPHDKTPKRRLSLASSSSASSTPTPKRNLGASPSLGIAPLNSDASPALPSQNSPSNGKTHDKPKGKSKRGFSGRRHLFPRSASLPACSDDKENMAPLSPDLNMIPIKVEIPAASLPPSFSAFSPTDSLEESDAVDATDDDSRHSAASGDSGHGSLDFTSFSSRHLRRQRRGRYSSGGASAESGIMSPDSIAIDDEETLMSPPIDEDDGGDADVAFRRKQLSGNSDDGFMDELESLSPTKEPAMPTFGIFSLLNAPIIKRDDADVDGISALVSPSSPLKKRGGVEEEGASPFTMVRPRRSSPVRQLRADSCPCPFSPVMEEATPLFELDVNSQPSPFSSASTTVNKAASQSRSSLLRFSHSFKRPEPPRHDENATPLHNSKRRKSVASPFDLRAPAAAKSQQQISRGGAKGAAGKLAVRSYSISDDRLERALSANSLAAGDDGVEELADCSGRTYVLPTVRGDHSDLKAISPQTMADLLEGKYDDRVENFAVVDCRYPYEYEGGHVRNGENLYTEEMVLESFFKTPLTSSDPEKRAIIIFHCEYSKERGPRLMRFLRKHDRKENAESYPYLQYPEIYLLDGGYKNFYESTQKTHCVPQAYVQMFEKQFASELRFFRRKTKSWAGNDPRATVGLQRTRTGLKF